MSTQTTTRIQRAQELIQTAFGKDRDLIAEYPLVFDPSFQGSLVGLEQEGEVVSACAVLPRDFVLNGWLLRLGLIGSVTTAEEHRGNGHLTNLLRRAEDVLACEGAVISMLWANDTKVYEGKGYVPIGLELDYQIPVNMAEALPKPAGVRWMETRDHAAVHALYVRHSHRLDRTLAETSALLHGPNITPIVCLRDGEVVAYTLMGRGQDLQGVVHEWGGATTDVLACVRGILENLDPGPEHIFMMCPASSVDMRKALLELEIPALEGVLAMAKVIDLPAMAQLFKRFGDPRLQVSVEEDHLRLTGPKGSLDLDRKHCLLACMPPQGIRGVTETLETETGIRFDGLPLYPFAWGLDSI